MKISPEGIKLIKHFEGLRLKTYYCSANVLTIGYGSTGAHVKEGMVITEQEAEELLRRDLKRFEVGVLKLISYPLSQFMFDALVAFSFNLGLGCLQRSTLRMKLNRGEVWDAANEFLKYNKAKVKGKLVILRGLDIRRRAEQKLFVSGI